MMLWLKTVFFHIGMFLAGLFSVPVPTGDSLDFSSQTRTKPFLPAQSLPTSPSFHRETLLLHHGLPRTSGEASCAGH